MIQYRIQCEKCAKSLRHGSTAPANPEGCVTARIMRMSCKEMGCRFQSIEVEFELNETDKLRLGLRQDIDVTKTKAAVREHGDLLTNSN